MKRVAHTILLLCLPWVGAVDGAAQDVPVAVPVAPPGVSTSAPPSLSAAGPSHISTTSAVFEVTLSAEATTLEVTMLWGTTDGMDHVGAWARTNRIGSYTNVLSTNFICRAVGLEPSTAYFARFHAANPSGKLWAGPSLMFRTAGPPTVENRPPDNVTATDARLNGILSRSDSADARIYWGPSDGGTDTNTWANVMPAGEVRESQFSAVVKVLAGGRYYYRCYAANAYGEDWADSTTTFVSAPALVSLSMESAPFFMSHYMYENGGGAVVTAGLSTAAASNVTVHLAFYGTADLNTDYAVSASSITIARGQMGGAITLTCTDDGVPEALENITVAIDSVDHGAIGPLDSVTAALISDEKAEVDAGREIAPDRLNWRLYDDPNDRGDDGWLSGILQWVKPLGDVAMELKGEHNIHLRGAFAVHPPGEAGRAIRMRVQDSKAGYFRVLFHAGDERYRIELDREQKGFLIAARLLGPPTPDNSKRSVERLTDDGGRWTDCADGLLDFRYQDGRILAARGPMVLISLPVKAPPTQMTMEVEGAFPLFYVLNLPPLDLKPHAYYLSRADQSWAKLIEGAAAPDLIGRVAADPTLAQGGSPLKALDELGERMLANGETADLSAWLDAWYALDFAVTGARDKRGPSLGVTRAILYDLYHARAWDTLRYRALQYRFLCRPREADTLASWMIDQAAAALDAGSAEKHIAYYERYWSHPLRVYSDHETQNVIDELISATEAGELERACRLLTKRLNVSSLSAVPGQPDLYSPAGALLRNLLRSNAALQQTLIDNFSGMGQIRLNRAVQQGSMDQLEEVALQFYGTPAGNQALGLLADRCLSMGRFRRASALYEESIPLAFGQQRTSLIGKRNLALAMIGTKPAEPVPGPVVLPGGSFSADQFEGIVESAYRGQHNYTASSSAPAPPPARKQVSLSRSMDLPVSAASPIGLTVGGKHLLLQQNSQMNAVDLEAGRAVWSYAPAKPGGQAAPSRPVIFGSWVVAALQDEQKGILTCLDLDQGRVAWEKKLESFAASEPVGLGSVVFVLTGSEQADLSLQGVGVAGGVSEFNQSLVRHLRDQSDIRAHRLISTEDAIVISAGGALLCCDDRGQIRWVRRMDVVPADADPALATPAAERSLLQVDDRIVVCSPNSPHIVCVDAATGMKVWSHYQPAWRYVIGRSDNVVYVRCNDSIEAVGVADGKTAWRLPVDQEHVRFLPAGDDSLLELRLDRAAPNAKPDDGKHVRRARWLSALDGRELATWPLPEESEEVHDVLRLISYGPKVFVITGSPTTRLSVLDIN